MYLTLDTTLEQYFYFFYTFSLSGLQTKLEHFNNLFDYLLIYLDAEKRKNVSEILIVDPYMDSTRHVCLFVVFKFLLAKNYT